MTASIIILGVLIILSIFSVGESILKRIKISRQKFMALLLLTLLLYFVPGITINGITFTWVGFVMPIIFSAIVLTNTRKLKNFLKIIVCILISFSLGIVYDLITFDVYEASIFQPYLVLAVLLGIVPLLIVGEPKKSYASNTIGLLLSEVFFYISRYSIYGEYYMTIGGEKIFACLIYSFVFSAITYSIARKIKVIVITKRLAKKERGQAI